MEAPQLEAFQVELHAFPREALLRQPGHESLVAMLANRAGRDLHTTAYQLEAARQLL